MAATSVSNLESSTVARDAITNDPTGVVRSLTQAIAFIWPKGQAPRRQSVNKMRGELLWGRTQPVRILYTLACSAIDEGKPLLMVLAPFEDFIAALEKYAARRERRQSSGVLSLHEVRTRVAMTSEREDSEADIARMQIKDGCIASLETARTERLQAIAAFEREVEAITAEIAELRVR